MEVQGGMGSLGLGQGSVLIGVIMIQRIHTNSASRFFLMTGELSCSICIMTFIVVEVHTDMEDGRLVLSGDWFHGKEGTVVKLGLVGQALGYVWIDGEWWNGMEWNGI